MPKAIILQCVRWYCSGSVASIVCGRQKNGIAFLLTQLGHRIAQRGDKLPAKFFFTCPFLSMAISSMPANVLCAA